MNDLPEKGWAGYGSPQHPLTPRLRFRPYPNKYGVAIHEMHAAVAEAWLDKHGQTSPELVAYLRGIGEASRG